jgi:23S rRNA pseudouridine2605 synthase
MPSKRDDTEADNSGERIAKAMARAGLCSRREAEAWIAAGRVAVNGAVIASPALNVDADDRITVDGAPMPGRERTRLFLYHKPRALVTTHADPQGRPTIFAALPKHLPRLLSVGRLDLNTEGLLLLTNDGGLARVLELPATGWLRRYRVRAHGSVHEEALARLRAGITIDGVRYGSIEASLDRAQGANVWLTFAMREGKNREVKNVLGHLGLKVNRLIRVSFGPFQLGELAAGGVAEVPTRVLREQLGARVAATAGVDFSGPIMERPTEKASLRRHPEVLAPAPGRERPVGVRAPQDDRRQNRASQKYRQRDAERLGEPALARRERKRKRKRGPERGKRR